jgi:pyruvate/2-oxoglutarate dehydrogenase complex dihydrolipoamide acyltransferase (E2) component
VQDTAGQAAGQAQDAAGGAAQQAQDTAQGAAQQAQEAAGGGQEEPNATEAAKQKAQELGVDLSQVEGSGAEGRITVKDVTSAANQG